jgi:hypothetical protein
VDLCKDVASVFICRILRDNQAMDAAFLVWGKHHPTESDGGCISSMNHLIRALAFAPIDVAIAPSYVALFRDAMTLRIPKSILSAEALEIVQFLENKRIRKYFFDGRISAGFDGKKTLNRFRFNGVVETVINRVALVRTAVFKGLMVSLCLEGGRYYTDVLHIFIAALQNILYVSDPYKQANPDPPTQVEIGLIHILSILGKSDILFPLLCEFCRQHPPNDPSKAWRGSSTR